MRAAKIEITFRRHVCYIRGYLARLTCLPDAGGGFWVVDGAEDEGDAGVVEGEGGEGGVDVGYPVWVGADAVLDFGVEAGGGAEDCDESGGVEEVEDAAGGDLGGGVSCCYLQECEVLAYLAASDDEDALVFDLPSED